MANAFLAMLLGFAMLVIKVRLNFPSVDVSLSLLLRAHALIKGCAIDFVRDQRFSYCRLDQRPILGIYWRL